VKPVIADGAKGPVKSIVNHFGPEKMQRCTVHKTRNILVKCPKNLYEELKAKLNRLWNQTSRFEAERYLECLVNEYGEVARRAIESLLEDSEDLLRFYGRPNPHWKTIRSTNPIERGIHEVRRRTKVMCTIALFCGPPIMIKLTMPVLTKPGFSPENIFTTLENRMKCGIGKCGRCNVGKYYVSKDGPVFTFAQVNQLMPEY